MATLKDTLFQGDLTSTHPIYPGYNDGAIGSQGSYYLYGNTGNSGIRTNGNFLVNGNIYWGNQSVWLTDWLNQNVKTNAGPTFAEVYTNGWFRNNAANAGLYHSSNGNHFYSTSAQSWVLTGSTNPELQFRAGHQGTVRGYLYGDSNNNFGILSNDGTWSVRVNNSEVELYHVTYADDLRANIIYDRNNTAYYMNMDGTSNIWRLQANDKYHYFGSSSNWDSGNLNGSNSTITNVHFQGHQDFWIGAGNTKWYGSAVTSHHDLLINTMQDSGPNTRGITFTATLSGTSTYRLGRWFSHNTQAGSYLHVDGSIKIGATSDYYSTPVAKLHVTGVTAGADVLAIDGVNGRLFTVTDDLSDSLFSVNTIAGLPVIEAFADNTVKIGPFTAPVEITSTGELKVNGGTNLGTAITGATVSNDTITFTRADGNTFAVTTSDADTNTVTSIGISGDLSTGNITLAGSGATTITKSGGTITISSTDTDTNTWRPLGTGATDAAAGNHNHNSTYLGISAKAADSYLVAGLDVHTGRNNEANKVVRTDANGYIQAGWINTTSGNNTTTTPNKFFGSEDGYIRYYDRAYTQMYLGNTYKYTTSRREHTSDSHYWTGVMGWGTTDWNSMFHWGSGFLDSWSSPGNQPPSGDGHHTGLQVLHYTNGTNAYGWQMAGAPSSNEIWHRHRWGTAFSTWRKLIDSANITSQSVNYANSAGSASSASSATTANRLDTYGIVYGNDWNSYYVNAKLIAAQAHGWSGANGPVGAYTYGSLLSYRQEGSAQWQMYLAENSGDSSSNQYKMYIRSGWNGSWGGWRRIVDMAGDTCTINDSPSATLKVEGSGQWGTATEGIVEVRAQSDNWATKSYRWRTRAGDFNGAAFYLDRYTQNGGWTQLGEVPKNSTDFQWQGEIMWGMSDQRVKGNILDMTNGLDKVNQIRPVTFDWVPTEGVSEREGADFGFIAQELEQIVPEAVYTRTDGYKTVRYEKVVPILLQAVKEQQSTINDLIARIEALESK